MSILKKGIEIKWNEQAKNSFNDIKRALGQAPLLISPYFSKGFHDFLFCLQTHHLWCDASEE